MKWETQKGKKGHRIEGQTKAFIKTGLTGSWLSMLPRILAFTAFSRFSFVH